MTKREIIQAAYGDYWEKVKTYVDENGHLDVHWWTINEINIPFYRTGFGSRLPKSLLGIENNNDWVKIESIDSFPKDPVLCITCIFLEGTSYKIGSSRNRTPDDLLRMWQNAELTHYKIIESKPPIY
ncbi:hypothetical protein [Chryseobacterium flavum]|uniref:hypothetical protein n=1 Tax=Chryseobacterium flavum TaxID=415851 RepID=UPI0028B1E911|nr:hypothetical protein [Chryseobacterium flavum]